MPKKIKICHVVSADITVKFLLFSQLKFLKRQGYEVSVVYSGGRWKKEIEAEGIKTKDIKITRRITPFYDLVSLFFLFLYFKKEKFDIVHTHTPKPGLLGQLAGKIAGVPIIINTIHGLYFNENSSPLKRKFYIFIEKIAGWCSDSILSQSEEDILTIVNEKIAQPLKVKYRGNGVNIEKFNPEKFSENFISRKKQELKINPDFKVVGTVGRLVKEKGYLELFFAFKNVFKKFPKSLLLIIGPEEPKKKDKFSPSVVKEFGIEKNVMFLGERTDIEELYPLMDVFVLASHREGFPRTVIEAMAEERPIIATNIRGCREAIKNNQSGILVPEKNPDKLAEAIIFMLENPDKAKEMAKNARKKAESQFDEQLVFDRIEKEYKELISRKL